MSLNPVIKGSYTLPAPSGVNEMETDDEDEAATDTDCGAANVYEPYDWVKGHV